MTLAYLGIARIAEAKQSSGRSKPNPDLAKKSAAVMTRYVECMTKVMMNAPPPPEK